MIGHVAGAQRLAEKMQDAACRHAFSGTERMRLDEWVDGLVLSFKQPVATPQKLSTAQVGQLLVYLKVQGMADESDLLWFELTRHTGQPAAPGDTEGGTYLGKASATKGGVAHRKAGEETYAKVLKEAVANEDFGSLCGAASTDVLPRVVFVS